MNTAGLKIDELSVSIGGSNGDASVLHQVSFTVAPGEVVGLVGESGGGKTMVARAITSQLPTMAHSSGHIAIDDELIASKFDHAHTEPAMLKAALCFQNPLTALSPTRRIGRQIVDRIVTHSGVERTEATAQALTILSQMGIRDPKRRMEVFPHELSGGMAQRVMIALAIACEPRILIADEPSTGLDVTLTRDIMKLFRDIADKGQQGVLIISHDIAAISTTCDRLMVLYAGSLVESGPTDCVLQKPAHPYTAALIDSVPTLHHRDDYQGPLQGSMPQFSEPPVACPFEPRCSFAEDDCRSGSPPTRPVNDYWTVKCFHSESAHLDDHDKRDESAVISNARTIEIKRTDRRAEAKKLIELKDVDIAYRTNWGKPSKRILKNISVAFNDGESVGIVGESGCGKSTLARAIMGLISPLSGQVWFDGIELAKQSPRQLRLLRRRMQLVFQDPLDALNPKLRVSQIIRDPLTLLKMTRHEINTSITRTLSRVRLDEQFSERLPSQLSGGQAQRVGIARGLVIDPELIVFDEPTSALDVTVQAQILSLIKTLIADRNRTYIFISHDLATIKDLCDRVVVMYMGRIVEDGPIDVVFDKPSHPYTRALLGAVPQLREETATETVVLRRDLDEAAAELAGCALAPRCPFVEDKCNMTQVLREISEKHSVACWRA